MRIQSGDAGYDTLTTLYNLGRDLVYNNRVWLQILDGDPVFVALRVNDLPQEIGLDPSGSFSNIEQRLDATIEDQVGAPINAKEYGAVGDGVTDDTAAIANAIVAAANKKIYFSEGTYICTINLSGKNCTIQGSGDRTIFKAPPGSTSPTINMTGYLSASNFRANRVFSDFSVEHDGTEGSSKKGIVAVNLAGIIFRNISVKNTGGACMDISGLVISSLENITLNTPINAKANDIPYLYGAGAVNGNRFIGLGLRSITPDSDVGVSGAVVLVDDNSWQPQSNVFIGTWVEFLHVPNNGTVFYFESTMQTISDTQFFDCSKESGATNTSYIRFGVPTHPGAGGGNIVNGVIPGHETDPSTLDYGVDILQSGNRVVGLKGYKGANVILRSGVQHTYIELGGSNSGSTDAAVIDSSGNSNNTIIDDYLGVRKMGPSYIEMYEISDPSAPSANRAVLYPRDNGSGKTQLVVRFPTGAIQVIATEP